MVIYNRISNEPSTVSLKQQEGIQKVNFNGQNKVCEIFFWLGRWLSGHSWGEGIHIFFGGGKGEKCLGKSFCEVQNGSGNLSITA